MKKNKFHGTPVEFTNHSGEVVLKFVLGEELKPDRDLVRQVILRMDTRGLLAPALEGTGVDSKFVAGFSSEGLDAMVPLIIRGADVAVQYGKLDFTDVLFAYINILSWYWYHIGGPKPLTMGEHYTKVHKTTRPIFHWTCPACTKEFPNPENLVHTGTIAIAYIKWMIMHCARYHGWGTSTGTPGASLYELKKRTKKEVPNSK